MNKQAENGDGCASIKVGLKYCGGCNPQYDRKALVTKFMREYPQVSVAPVLDDGVYDFVLVICGCRAECFAYHQLQGKWGQVVVFAAEDYKKVKQKMSHLLEAGGRTAKG